MGVGRSLWGLSSLAIFFWIATGTYAHAAIFTVNSIADAVDANPGDGICATSGGTCTLRAAIMEANHLASGPRTIILPAGSYTLTIPPSVSATDEAKGDLDITANMDIVGAGSSSTIIDGNQNIISDRVIEISSGITVNISDVRIQNGKSLDSRGGGIFNNGGILTLTNSTVSGNSASTGGGGISNFGDNATLTLTNSTVSGNSDGGIASFSFGDNATVTLTLTNSIVSGNSDVGISSKGQVTLINSTVSGNSSRNIGGISHVGDPGLTIINSTVSGNSATGDPLANVVGGIIVFGGTLTMINSTVSNNHATVGSGIRVAGGIRIETLSHSNIIIESTINGNSATGNDTVEGRGGGIQLLQGALTLINTTVSGNSATSGGGIHNTSTTGALDIFNSTITGNTAGTKAAPGSGGGVFTGALLTTTFQNTILAGNRAFRVSRSDPTLTLEFNDCAGTIDSDGPNLMRVQSCTVTGDAPIVADPKLGLLKFNGGPTKTHALLSGSPAIDTGDCELGPKVRTDQRGFRRPVDGDQNGSFGCDIGSYELASGSAAPVDLGGDGETDVVVYQTSTGNWFAVESSTGFFRPAVNFGGSDFLPVPGDYDADGRTDAAVYQQSTGNWFAVGTTSGFFSLALNFGGTGFIPVPGDYDGDGKTDAAVYQSSTGHWFIKGSTSGFFQVLSFGGAGFIPVPGDYDGDGKIDAAVYQASTGNWFVVGTTAGFFTPALNFGGSGFVPVPGDYDGDGKSDAAVYQSSTGNWFALGSTSGFRQVLNFGGSGFTPVAGDYDGDGKTDAAVYQQNTGNWFVLGSTTGFFSPALNFGGSGFVPVLPPVTIVRALGLL